MNFCCLYLSPCPPQTRISSATWLTVTLTKRGGVWGGASASRSTTARRQSPRTTPGPLLKGTRLNPAADHARSICRATTAMVSHRGRLQRHCHSNHSNADRTLLLFNSYSTKFPLSSFSTIFFFFPINSKSSFICIAQNQRSEISLKKDFIIFAG